MLRGNNAWSAAPKIYRIDYFCLEAVGSRLHLEQDAFVVSLCRLFIKRNADKVAVVAFAPAEWNMNIDPKAHE